MLSRLAYTISDRFGAVVSRFNFLGAWSVLLLPPLIATIVYLCWMWTLLLRPQLPSQTSYAVHLRSEQAGLQQQLQMTQYSLQAAERRMRRLEARLLAREYDSPPALPAVTRPSWKAALKP